MTSKPQLNIRAKALYRFVPENEEELDLNEGDIVIIYEKHDDGWCVGNFDGKVGYFPAAYIEELPPPQQRPVKAAPSTPKLAEAPPLEIKQVGTLDNASPATTPHSARPTLKSADDSGINARPTGSPRQLPNPGHGTMRKALGNHQKTASLSSFEMRSGPLSAPVTPTLARVPEGGVAERSNSASTSPALPPRITKELPKPPPKPQRPLSGGKTSGEGTPPPIPPKREQGSVSPTQSLSNSSSTTPAASPLQRRMSRDSSDSLTRSNSTSIAPRIVLPPSPKTITPEQETKRGYIVKETYTTEVTYIECMETALMKYYKPLLEKSKNDPSINVDHLRNIFSSLENIMPLNKKLLQQIEERVKSWSNTQLIGDVFLLFAPFLKLYTTYSKNYESAIQSLEAIQEEEWFIKQCENKLFVEKLIITPIQRIPRYSLLLEDLLKNTAEDHPDSHNIRSALMTVKEVAEHVNSSIKFHKNVTKLHDAGLGHLLAPHRQMVRDSTLTVTVLGEIVNGIISSKKASKPKVIKSHFVLFSDILAIVDEPLAERAQSKDKKKGTSIASKLTGKKKTHFGDISWPLYLIWVKDLSKTGLEVIGPNTSFLLQFDNSDEKSEWQSDFQTSIEAMLNASENYNGDMINRFGKYVFENGEIYEGNWREGKMHGRGRLEWFDSVYEGDFEYGLRTGNGTLRYTSDQTYTGAWKTGRPHGQGTLTYGNGDKYVGEWKDGKKHGTGAMNYSTGDKYEGEWRNDYANGLGKLTLVTGLIYDGDWQDSKFNGQGKLVYPNGGKYSGMFASSARSGRGQMIYPDGSEYNGEWRDDRRLGIGKFNSMEGFEYDGEWKDDRKEGRGKMKYVDGSVYEGIWKDDKPHGTGVFTSKGYLKRYEGDFNVGRRQGHGVAYFENGDKYDGEFKDNVFNGVGKYIYSNGTVVEGKWVRGVRDGRTTVYSPKKEQNTFEEESLSSLYIIPPSLPLFDDSLVNFTNMS
jgi:hypothetical protein